MYIEVDQGTYDVALVNIVFISSSLLSLLLCITAVAGVGPKENGSILLFPL